MPAAFEGLRFGAHGLGLGLGYSRVCQGSQGHIRQLIQSYTEKFRPMFIYNPSGLEVQTTLKPLGLIVPLK